MAFALSLMLHGLGLVTWKQKIHLPFEEPKEGKPSGRYLMLFEFYTIAGHHAYKERRKDWSGPYTEYKKVDPYHLFNHDSVKIEYWEPQETNLWFEFE